MSAPRSTAGSRPRCPRRGRADGGGGSARRQLQPVADAPNRLDARVGDPRGGELLADLLNMDVHCPCVARKVVTPYQVQQLAALEHATGMPRQEREEVELLRPELYARGALADLVPLEVDFEPARPDQLGLVRLEPSSAQQRLGARHQLLRMKGLGQVIVGAHLEADDLVGDLV